MKITFMGAGSTIFAKNVIGDSMLTPALRESEFALYDILEDRLEESYMNGNFTNLIIQCGYHNHLSIINFYNSLYP